MKTPSRVEAKVEEVMHRITQHTDRICAKLKNGGKKRMQRAISKKHTRMAVECFSLEGSGDGEEKE